MNIFLDVIGCRLNQSEVEGIANTFRALGHEIVGDPSRADLAIVNTCAVTVKAAADSRKKLRRAGRKGASRVVATGCWASLYPQRALDLAGVNVVVTNEEKQGLVSTLTEVPQDQIDSLEQVREPLPGDRARTRAFIKVQEGCDNHCTYCLTRLARGKSRSRTLNEIQRDIDVAVAGSAKEIVLTGVQLGAWGRDLVAENSLVDLLDGILTHGGFKRLRLSSIEPWDFQQSLLSFWTDERMCRHLHVPLQSGDDRILAAMGRPITSRRFKDLIDGIRVQIPDIAITTDVIAGFPGESTQEFINTKEFIQAVGFAGGHIFTYSPRPGTAAYNMKEQVPRQIAKARNAILREVFTCLGKSYREKFIGETMEVLWETSERSDLDAWQLSGLTDNYLRVFAEYKKNMWNLISQVHIDSDKPTHTGLAGHLE